ncbi:NAD(P)H-dependent oxidoreductase [Roseovarius indicus]|uniref:Glutathione-regulated potassium-efflux system ancillary protein KefF n=1 Tax=Roseovarius indicus TaxID=540747 RepID=A0A0T5P1J0_9RHOB|nr:NAD(P)H-dependent oxidoreductase [Roseovarius indicus]KRS15016.1 NAD(P)H dehydrogenase [Roseovarius indicus]QEW25332.1 Glutathione-regulated potassium-efflux system ancillary protein KefF [Roseovarius indicus]SFE20933.1 NAD(P)H dehydrogenase (quinone) [Roseovarius indicus]
MKTLVVHAHPEPQSFNSAMAARLVDAFKARGDEVATSDLYQMGFNPVASAADFTERGNPEYLNYALEQRHGVKTETIAPDIRAELDKLLWCDTLVLNFPIFWFSTPAILKGWIDRVFVSGAVYGGRAFYDKGRLRGRRAMVSVSLGGRTNMFGPGAVHGPLEDMLRPLLRGTLYYAGFDVVTPFVAHHVPYIDDAARAALLEELDAHVARFDSLETLSFPSLDDFDDQMNPIAAGQGAST